MWNDAMNRPVPTLAIGVTCLIASFSVIAQSEQPTKEVPPPPQFEGVTSNQDQQSGLRVEERRFENRLDGVTIQHSGNGPTEYYDLNDPDIERRDGGITEGSAMRTWRLGGRKK
jgi:hypothetical protein